MSYQFTVANARSIIDALPIPELPEVAGRGIIIAAGGRTYNTNAYLLIRLLRHLGCSLPIQVWCLQREHDPSFNALVEPYGAKCVNAGDIEKEHPHSHLNGWELKSYAIKWCEFAEVLFLDADNFPVRDPAALFESEEYRTTGALFWPDHYRLERTRAFWEVYQVPYVDEPEFESGMIYIDKARHWREICIADFISEYGIEFFWGAANVHGDKESWHAAYNITGKPYTMCPFPLLHMPKRTTMMQYDFDGNLMFQHRNMQKFNLLENPVIENFVYEAELHQWVAELRALWLQFKPEPCEWLAGKKFLYVRVGHDHREMEFLANGMIGAGRGGAETFYYYSDDAIHMLGENVNLTAVFRRSHLSQVWVGQWLYAERMPCLLVERQV